MALKRYPCIAAFEPELIRGPSSAPCWLDPRNLVRNPVIFLVSRRYHHNPDRPHRRGFFPGMVSLWLWRTCLQTCRVVSKAGEGTGRVARESRTAVPARRLREEAFGASREVLLRLRQATRPGAEARSSRRSEIGEGAALVNEAAITGESPRWCEAATERRDGNHRDRKCDHRQDHRRARQTFSTDDRHGRAGGARPQTNRADILISP